jgi:tetratricopeptide (TPR) repeat protein
LFERALTEAKKGIDRVGEIRARRILAECADNRGDISTARQHLDTAIPIAVAEGHELLHAHCVAALAQLLCAAGELDEAELRIGEVLDESVDADPSVDVWMRGELGRIMFERGDYVRARAGNERIIKSFGSEPNLNLVMHAHIDLIKIELAAGSIDAAAAHVAVAAKLRPETSAGWDAYLATARGGVALLRGDWPGALAHIQRADELVDQTVETLDQCEVLRMLGDAQLALDCPNDAIATFERLIQMAGSAPFRCRLAEGHEGAAAAGQRSQSTRQRTRSPRNRVRAETTHGFPTSATTSDR